MSFSQNPQLYSTVSFRSLFVSTPLLLLFFVVEQGLLHRVHDRQNWLADHPGAITRHQHSSREEFHRMNENPFENNTNINITVPLGDTAFLRCRAHNLGERSISWIRRRDYHILTTGKVTYTNDERFHVLHTEGTEDWTLQIKFVQKRDNGSYECQVSTGTGVASFLIHLFIAVPEAFILGNGEYHVEQGSTINLVCVVEKSPKPPEYIFWYHNSRMINYGSSRELSVHTEPGTGKTHSRLIIRNAHLSHSGNYTCKAANADPASILVYVSQASGLFTGDQTAAIQQHKTTSSSSSSSSSSSTSSSEEKYVFVPFIIITTPLWLISTLNCFQISPFGSL